MQSIRPDEMQLAAEAILKGKGVVSDAIFERQATLDNTEDPTVSMLDSRLKQAKIELSTLFSRGPQGDLNAYKANCDSLSRRITYLERELFRRSRKFRQSQRLKRITVNRIKELLPPKSVLIEYIRFRFLCPLGETRETHYAVVIVENSGEPLVLDLGSAKRIDAAVSVYRDHMLNIAESKQLPSRTDLAVYNSISRRLYSMILEPIDSLITTKDLIFVAPDGALNLVSFAGLKDCSRTYLVEKHAIQYLSSGRDLMRFTKSQRPGFGLIAFGDPDFDASCSERLNALGQEHFEGSGNLILRSLPSSWNQLSSIHLYPLPATRREIELVAKRWREATGEPSLVYVGADASEERFKRQASGKRVIHIATHGYYLSRNTSTDNQLDRAVTHHQENPLLLAGIFLAGANCSRLEAARSSPDEPLGSSEFADDGILTAYEVSTLNLEGTDLVVLSACETGLGEIRDGEGVYGLRRAFQIAGARAVVSALWQVPDETTAEMMAHLYASTHATLPKRIRAAQLEAIKKLRTTNRCDHPFLWASFITIGDWHK